MPLSDRDPFSALGSALNAPTKVVRVSQTITYDHHSCWIECVCFEILRDGTHESKERISHCLTLIRTHDAQKWEASTGYEHDEKNDSTLKEKGYSTLIDSGIGGIMVPLMMFWNER